MYRIFPGTVKIIVKVIHGVLLASAMSFAIASLIAVFNSHNMRTTPVPKYQFFFISISSRPILKLIYKYLHYPQYVQLAFMGWPNSRYSFWPSMGVWICFIFISKIKRWLKSCILATSQILGHCCFCFGLCGSIDGHHRKGFLFATKVSGMEFF